MHDCWSGKAVIWIIGKYATKFAGLCGELCVCLGAASGNGVYLGSVCLSASFIFTWPHRDSILYNYKHADFQKE